MAYLENLTDGSGFEAEIKRDRITFLIRLDRLRLIRHGLNKLANALDKVAIA